MNKIKLLTKFKNAFKKLKTLKVMPLAGKFTLRLFINYTESISSYTLNKFNKFSNKFIYPNSPFMIYNFSACENLRHSWMILS